MLCSEIINVIEDTYPKHAALEWDNVGLLVGRAKKEVKKIYVALDATDEVIDAAITVGADMLVTHHPLIFSALKNITDEHFIGGRVVKLLQHDISYYAMHTNYDVLGMAELSGNVLGLHQDDVFEIADEEKNIGIGRIGYFNREITLEECCKLVKQAFNLSTVKLFGNRDAKVKRVAICPGSGKHMSELAIEKGVDVLVTGDIDYHEGIDAVSQGLAIVDAGHYGLEHIFIEDMAKYLETHLENIQVEKAEIVQPFEMI